MEYKEKKIRIKTPFNIMQVGKWMKLQKDLKGMKDDEIKARTVEIYSNLTYHEAFNKIDYSSLNQAYDTIIKEMSTYLIGQKEAPEFVKVEGVKYKYMADLTKLTVAERMDILAMGDNVFDQPNKLMAILYRSDKVSVKDAIPIFSDKFPPDVFYKAWRFFFLKLESWSKGLILIQEDRLKQMKRMERMMKMEQKFQQASRLWRLFILCQIFFIGMSRTLRQWFTQHFYLGKTLGSKKLSSKGKGKTNLKEDK